LRGPTSKNAELGEYEEGLTKFPPLAVFCFSCMILDMDKADGWQISEPQKELLDSLFGVIDGEIKKVIDIGSGRTSVFFLTEKFKNITIKGLVYPGDQRKIEPIKKCVPNNNYELIESDINDFESNEVFDVVLAHLFLGEAEKFADNKFDKIVDQLFKIKTRYFVIVNLERDLIDYKLLNQKISEIGEIVKNEEIISESGDKCVGITIKTN
jgi:hypothetical protein